MLISSKPLSTVAPRVTCGGWRMAQGMGSIVKDGLAKAVRGQTTIEEIYRSVSGPI